MGLFSEISYGPCPSFALGNVLGGTVLAAGNYAYQVAFNLAAGITGLSPIQGIQTPDTGGVGITITPAFVPAGATGFQIYRTTNGGGNYYAITNSPFALTLAGTQIVDRTSDATLIGNAALPAVTYGGLISVARLAQLTNSDSPQGVAAGPNYAVLQSLVWQAQSWFYRVTGVPYDDTTPSGPPPAVPTNQPSTQFPPLGGNVCHSVGVVLVIKLAYDYRAQSFPQAEVEAARREATAALKEWLTQFGNARWAAPGTDSLLTPSQATGLPDFDRARLQRSIPNDPLPYPSPQAQGAQGQGWGPGDF